jgi:hypothetical protein
MPRSFQDVVQVTRAFGLEINWIDSFYRAGFERRLGERIGRMADTYRFSAAYTAAHTSKHCDDGIFEQRPTRNYVSITAKSNKLNISGSTLLRPSLKDWNVSLWSSSHSTLAAPGWVLRENILAPRSLRFGAEQRFWECPNAHLAESDFSPFQEDEVMLTDLD